MNMSKENKERNKYYYLKGIKVGMPICLGYFAVSFALGIAARNAGLTAGQAAFTSMLVNASAGQYAGFLVIAGDAGYLEMVVMELVANARYLLMSCALSQKLGPETGLLHRLLVGFDLTDEIFGVAVSVPEKLNPYYNYGMMTVAIPGWALGTFFGVVMGNVLPQRVVRALSVALYGMFIAIIVPPARKNKVIAGLIITAMGLSFLFAVLPVLSGLSSGVRTIILTILISGGAAVLFPVKEEKDGA